MNGSFRDRLGWKPWLLLPASAASPLRRGILRHQKLARFTEPKLAEGERRLVDQTGIEPATS